MTRNHAWGFFSRGLLAALIACACSFSLLAGCSENCGSCGRTCQSCGGDCAQGCPEKAK